MSLFKTKYGYFENSSTAEYVVTDPRTPLPWVNIICPDKLGVAVTAAGDGFTWYEHAGHNMLTRWLQDFPTQSWGKFIYIVDNESGETWSASFSPCKREYRSYRAVHGIGYTEFIQTFASLETKWKITVDPETNVEVWRLHVRNLTDKPRSLSVVPYFEWCLGDGSGHHRQIHECFLRTEIDGNRCLATRSMWTIPSDSGHWNAPYPYTAFFLAGSRPHGWQPGKRKFLGPAGRMDSPEFAFETPQGSVAGSNDAIMAMSFEMNLAPHESVSEYFMLGATRNRANLEGWEEKILNREGFSRVEERVAAYWDRRLSGLTVDTPDGALNLLVNRWLKYQVFSSRIFGRSGYYIQGGGFGYREIQDLLTVIPLEPPLARKRLLLYAENQYSDLSIPHHFDLLTGEKGAALWSDDMLWLPFVTVHYLNETNDLSLLNEQVRYIDADGGDSYYEHCVKGLDRVWNSRGECGLPLIKEGDWNDGLSAVGIAGRGESVWLGHFLAGILRDFIEIAVRVKDHERAAIFEGRLDELKGILNSAGWDGSWYRRARCDGGKWIGSRENSEGRVFLNAQAWAILHDVVDGDERLAAVVRALDDHIYSAEGPLLFSPPYGTPDPDIGYLTRYNPGVRENGGVYVHAGNWALQAEARLGRKEKVWYIYERLCPVLRSFEDPDRFQSEPYVTCGNIEAEPSPFAGKGAWSWYTSSGAWFYKVLTEEMLGIRPRHDGLEVRPQVPANWEGFTVTRAFRGRTLTIEVRQEAEAEPCIYLDGEPIEEDYVPERRLSRDQHHVTVVVSIGRIR